MFPQANQLRNKKCLLKASIFYYFVPRGDERTALVVGGDNYFVFEEIFLISEGLDQS
jgi:hypothetical protein